ncbi:DnaJ-domain-containing protein [Ascobolus immersus RN42]|uniref:DnaJ-domain-containing protein n=1 Tax=Ascobolus immersus RN42 TaxID=1160509 RepID=A0A3N4IFW3_ASCIM|nr:DnaJ-domain-containing protein [Ascobolus immersus RN42]
MCSRWVFLRPFSLLQSKAAALASSEHDFYQLLGVESGDALSESVLRKAFRKASLLVHPDKNPSPDAAEKFHLLTIAYDVLSDPTIRTAYDKARNARKAKVERVRVYDAKRRKLQEELEAREGAYSAQKKEEQEAEADFQRELARLKAESANLRKKREEALRKAQEEEEKEGEVLEVQVRETKAPVSRFTEIDRTVKIKWRNKGSGKDMDSEELQSKFRKYGKIAHCIAVKEGKPTADGKEKKFRTGLVVFESIVGAHGAVTDGMELKDSTFKDLKEVKWAGEAPPEIPREALARTSPPASTASATTRNKFSFSQRVGSGTEASTGARSKKPPSFGSFKGTASSGTSTPTLGTDYENITLMRLREAEKRKLEEEIRKRDEEAES